MTAQTTKAGDAPLEPHALYLRGYVVRDKNPAQGAFTDPESEEVDALPPGDWTLTFDCETTTDAAQSLRFGAYQLRKNGKLTRNGQGLFYADSLSAEDLAVLQAVAERDGLRLLPVKRFVNWILFCKVFTFGGVVVGFNLPFDISRLAIKHGSAQKSMRGGFSFKLSTNTNWPRIRIKHVSARMAFIRYGGAGGNPTPAGQKKLGVKVQVKRGSFVDVKTLAAGLLSGNFNLLRLSRDTLKVPHPKLDIDDHGGPLTAEYVGYCQRDVQATWECYEVLTSRLAGYGLTTIEPKTLFSEASLGKAYLKQMGVKPWRELQPDFPPAMIGQILSTYFGGRAEVHIRRQRTQVLYCDFLSMYPTVCTLMGLWRFVIAKGVVWRDATAETQALLDRIQPADMMQKPAWRDMTTLVQLAPDDDILPVRARYGETSSNIGVNRLSAQPGQLLWFTLADVIAAKVLGGGKTPVIARAVRFDPGDKQDDLSPIHIAGKPEFAVEPADDNFDFYRRVIELRQTVKAKLKAAEKEDKPPLDAEQLALKILANATSYGIFIEMVVKSLDKAEVLTAYGVDGVAFPVTTEKYEDPGYYFHPLLATLITGAARLMLALAERRALDEGLDWVFCDTDSLAMARPAKMAPADFIAAGRRVCDSFLDLNPYERRPGDKPASILQVEKQNFAPGLDGDWSNIKPLYCFAVSAKRYALFNIGDDGQLIIRKASAHGLGHLRPPYLDPDEERAAKRLEEIGVDLWQEDLWKRIIVAAADDSGGPDAGMALGLENDPRLTAPAASRYAAATPAQLDWFKLYNRPRSYEERVRPFNFLLSLQSERMEQIAHSDPAAHAWWSKYKRDPAPAAPFDRDPAKAAQHAFDRHHRNMAIPVRWLVTYAHTLADYHLQPENKFAGGEIRRSNGVLRRRHIQAGAIQHIGKEANRWEEQLHLGEDDDEIAYGLTPERRLEMAASIALVRKKVRGKKFPHAAGVSDRTLAAAANVATAARIGDAKLIHIHEVGMRLWKNSNLQSAADGEVFDWAYELAMIEGVHVFAKRIGIDGANFGHALAGRRGLSKAMLASLRQARDG